MLVAGGIRVSISVCESHERPASLRPPVTQNDASIFATVGTKPTKPRVDAPYGCFEPAGTVCSAQSSVGKPPRSIVRPEMR